MPFQRDGFELWSLSNADQSASLEVIPERGGLISSLKFGGHESLYLDWSTVTDRSKNVRGGIPLLFPFCGPLVDGKWQVGDKTYVMKQHGFARDSKFRVAETPTGLELSLSDSPDTLALYPFAFELKLLLSFEGARLNVDCHVINHSESPMPYQWGAHPYFNVGAAKQFELDLPVTDFFDSTVKPRVKQPVREQAKPDWHNKEVDLEYWGLTRDWAQFKDLSNGRSIQVGYDSSFPHLVVWNLPAKDFLCLEPWTGPRFGFQEGHLNVLPAGQTAAHRFWIEQPS